MSNWLLQVFKGNYVLHGEVNLQKHLKLKWKPFKIDKLEQQRFVHWHHSFSLFCTFITCSSHVFTNPESTNPYFLFTIFSLCCFSTSEKFWIKIKIDKKMPIKCLFKNEKTLCNHWKNMTGFVKTYDEHISKVKGRKHT